MSSSSDESRMSRLCLLWCVGRVMSAVCFRFFGFVGLRLLRFSCGALSVGSSSSSASFSSSASSSSVSSWCIWCWFRLVPCFFVLPASDCLVGCLGFCLQSGSCVIIPLDVHPQSQESGGVGLFLCGEGVWDDVWCKLHRFRIWFSVDGF